ncbi:hypothetical protein Tco_0362839 [Tanacetum coccineum]
MAPATRRGPNTTPNNTNPNNMTPKSVQAMIDQALLRNSTNGDKLHQTSNTKPTLDFPIHSSLGLRPWERSILGLQSRAELHERDTQDLYALLEDAQDETIWIMEEEAYASREAWAHSIGLSQAVHHELQTHRDHVYAHETHIQAHQAQLQLQSTLIQTHHQVYETRFQMQQAEMAAL